MSDEKKLEEIQKRLDSNAYFINPHSDVNVAEDMRYLLDQLKLMHKKNDVLAQQTMELAQEIENVKSDFGNSR